MDDQQLQPVSRVTCLGTKNRWSRREERGTQMADSRRVGSANQIAAFALVQVYYQNSDRKEDFNNCTVTYLTDQSSWSRYFLFDVFN